MNKRKSFHTGLFKTRSEPDGGKYIEGYFAVFNQRTQLWPGVFEEIDPAAFDNSLKNNDIRGLYNHNADIVLGRTTKNTLELKTDEHGLHGIITINENDKQALDIYARVARGDIDGCSFGFYPIREEFTDIGDGEILYRVLEADTSEVSICPFPAYPQTEVQARKADYEKSRSRERGAKINELKIRMERLKK